MDLSTINFDKLVMWCEAAGVDNSDEGNTNRGFHSDLLQGGWPRFVRNVVRPELEFLAKHTKGPRRIVVHNPYGVEGKGKPFRFGQRRLCAVNPKTAHISEGFRDAFKPIVDEGVEVVGYVGMFKGEPAFNLPPKPMIDELLYQIEDLVAAGCAIGLDASFELNKNGTAFKMMQMLPNKKFLEPRPHAAFPHLHAFPIICQEPVFHRTNPAVFPDAAHIASNEQLTGEIVIWAQYPDNAIWSDPFDKVCAGLFSAAKRIQREGRTAAIAGGWWSKMQ